MQLTDGKGAVSCTELTPADMKATTCPLAVKILKLLAAHPQGLHAFEIAKQLKMHEQKIYYHTRRMTKAGILIVERTEDGRGGVAKILSLKTPAFALRLQEFEPMARVATYLPEHIAYLDPFIKDGKLHATIIVGSPDPHGPEHARSRDGNYAIDLALFLGTFLTTRASPAVQLDTEMRDWNQNLIIIGGPVVNKAAEKVNAKSLAPYDREVKAFMVKGKQYGSEEVGIIVKMPNPFAKGKWILHIAGRRHTGTKAAILAFLTAFDKVCKNNVIVVEGLDADSDGIIESVKIL
jgi:DNA-binding transcriptional ArsR family regulator